MTTIPNEGDTHLEEENLNAGQTAATEEAEFVEDVDPIIAEMRAAEAEVAAEAAKGTQPAAVAPVKTETQPGTAAPAAPAATAPKEKTASPMIPKARLDEVLSENALLKDQIGYMRGLKDAARAAPAQTATEPKQPAATAAQPAAGTGPGQGGVDEIETLIGAQEARKLELAEKYDNGEISSKQWKEGEILIDKEIRALATKRVEAVRDESRREAQSAVAANNFESVKNNTGLQLQAKHPNVAVIDSLSEGVRDGVWADITRTAAANLAARGIDVKDGNPNTKLLLIQEKAKLTDNLEHFIPWYKAPAAAAAPKTETSGQPSQPKPSETALNRKAKIDLANSQPPSTSDMGNGADNRELTEADIENMTEDQMADLLTKAPNLVNRVLGNQHRG